MNLTTAMGYKASAAMVGITALGMSLSVQARDQVRVVGSSTVYPFASYVAEELGATTDQPTPVVEHTGSGGGMKHFCAGNDLNTPDITNASRQMKVSEFKRCQDNGVTEITEAMIGYDGIVVGHNVNNPSLDFTRQELTLAVAAEVPKDGQLVANPYTHWDQINPELPNWEILIYGPPTTSGTRDAFEELVMAVVTEEMSGYGGAYTKVRQDGAFVPAGENDNLIVQKLAQNRNAVGIFGFSFLEENQDKIQGAYIDGVAPKRGKISSGEYPVSRSLYFYIKNSHEDEVSSMGDYIELFMSERMIGDLGFLKNLGLIPLPAERRQEVREQVANRLNLKLSDLQ